MSEQKICRYCGKTLTGQQKVCCRSELCVKAYHKEYVLKHIALKDARTRIVTDTGIVYESICHRCGTRFTRTEGRGGAKYCSEECRKQAYVEQHRKASREYEQRLRKRDKIW